MGLLSNPNLKHPMNPSQTLNELKKTIDGEIFQEDEILRFYSVDASLSNNSQDGYFTQK